MINQNGEQEQTLNQILSEMDGFESNTGVLVLAATNRRDVLDDALLRPGRFDRLIYVPLPDTNSREAILRLYLKNQTHINITDLAKETAGFSGAELKNVLNEASIFAARKGETVVTKEYMDEALEKIVVGLTKRVDRRPLEDRRRVAIHELGHAILAAVFRNEFDLKRVSIKSTYEGAGGFTIFHDRGEESGLYTKDTLQKRIIVSLGGRAAEQIVYGDLGVSVGASQDLKQANELARQMVEQFGLAPSFDAFSINGRSSDKTRAFVDDAILSIVNDGLKEAKRILLKYTAEREELTATLLEEVVMDGKIVVDKIYS